MAKYKWRRVFQSALVGEVTQLDPKPSAQEPIGKNGSNPSLALSQFGHSRPVPPNKGHLLGELHQAQNRLDVLEESAHGAWSPENQAKREALADKTQELEQQLEQIKVADAERKRRAEEARQDALRAKQRQEAERNRKKALAAKSHRLGGKGFVYDCLGFINDSSMPAYGGPIGKICSLYGRAVPINRTAARVFYSGRS